MVEVLPFFVFFFSPLLNILTWVNLQQTYRIGSADVCHSSLIKKNEKSANLRERLHRFQKGRLIYDIFALSSRKGYTGENKQNILREQLNP